MILRGRHLESANFYRADLRNADLYGAQLQGALLDRAQLQGALLDEAQLQGASLQFAHLQGASLAGANLRGASLLAAKLQGAFLLAAKLQGVSLDSAQLQGASLHFAQLQGASLTDAAELQGAEFRNSTVVGTAMSSARVWRTSFEDASLTAVFEDRVEESAISKGEFAELQAMIMKEVAEGENREYALKRIEKLNPDIFGPEASAREVLEKGHVDETAYKKSLAAELKSLACSGDESASYILRGLVENGGIMNTGAQAPGLVDAILDPGCPVSAALIEADKAALKEIAKKARGAH